jgi:hypothetical protein
VFSHAERLWKEWRQERGAIHASEQFDVIICRIVYIRDMPWLSLQNVSVTGSPPTPPHAPTRSMIKRIASVA